MSNSSSAHHTERADSTSSGDPLFPAEQLFPLFEPGGGVAALRNVPGPVRPLVARLAVAPRAIPMVGATQREEVKQTQYSEDGQTKTDATTIVVTD